MCSIRELYGVVIDRDTMSVDVAATLACRQQQRAPAAGPAGAVQAERYDG
jgi:hypothetical protein